MVDKVRRTESTYVLTESTISSLWRSNYPRPSPDFSPRLQDKIWEWSGDRGYINLSVPLMEVNEMYHFCAQRELKIYHFHNLGVGSPDSFLCGLGLGGNN